MRLDSDCFLVALGCHGHAFHGSQVQPDVRTVEGSLLEREWLARLS